MPKTSDENIWDVSQYSDEEIISEILDMSNPTDRELEIKIWSTIKQYQNAVQTKQVKRWLKFYQDIYHRLFSFSESESEYGSEDGPSSGDENIQPSKKKTNSGKLLEGLDTTNPLPTSAPNPQQSVPQEADTSTLVTTTNYVKGNLNPLLKEVLTRSLTIDSQYRDNKNEQSTNFILNLTETIKDVVQIKLFSAHIPFTWYTISTDFGSNYFFIKGNAPGINDETHDFQLNIAPGNYTQNTLATAVNAAIQQQATTHTDISFGTTSLNYNPNNSTMTFTIDIQNIFNESAYYLNFPYTDASNISTFLGYNDLSYDLVSVKSQPIVPYTQSTATNYIISSINDPSKNYVKNDTIWIIQYKGPEQFVSANSTIIASYPITINSTTNTTTYRQYSRTSLSTEIQNKLLEANYLDVNYLSLDPLTNTYQYFTQIPVAGTTNSYYQFRIKLDRTKTPNNQYTRLAIFLPDDSAYENNTWTTGTLQFSSIYPSTTIPLDPSNNLWMQFYANELISDIPTKQSDYPININNTINFLCNNPQYITTENLNNFSLTVSPSTGNGYTLTQYLSAINTAFTGNNATSGYFNLSSLPNNSNGNPFTINNNSIGQFNIDMNFTFNQNAYVLDLCGTTLYSILNVGYGQIENNNYLLDLSTVSNNVIDFSFNLNTQYDMTGNLLTVLPNVSLGNKNAVPFYIPLQTHYNAIQNPLGGNIYTGNPQTLGKDVEYSLRNYVDQNLGTTPFENSTVNINSSLIDNSYYNGNIHFHINQVLTESNYSMALVDASYSWTTNFGMSCFKSVPSISYINGNVTVTSTTDNSGNIYVLSDYHQTGYSYSTVSGSSVVKNNEITIYGNINGNIATVNSANVIVGNTTNQNMINNIFNISPIPFTFSNGLQSIYNNLTFTIPPGTYTRDQLLNQINSDLSNNINTRQSYLSIIPLNGSDYCNTSIIVNKTFTSSDYEVVFYDSNNFRQCNFSGKNVNIQNATWDTTLGWILGFREYSTYDLSTPEYITTTFTLPDNHNICTIVADTTCTTTLFNYFILCLDDYNQNHTNDGLVTITTPDNTIPLPSYANLSQFVCDDSGNYVYTGVTDPGTNNLTQNQIYAITQILNGQTNANNSGNVPITKFSSGPFIKDVLAVIPVKTAGVTNGQTLIIDGGTLQTQTRQYFGPINLNRISVTLYDDRGHIVNLNNSNWSFTLLVDQLYPGAKLGKK